MLLHFLLTFGIVLLCLVLREALCRSCKNLKYVMCRILGETILRYNTVEQSCDCRDATAKVSSQFSFLPHNF